MPAYEVPPVFASPVAYQSDPSLASSRSPEESDGSASDAHALRDWARELLDSMVGICEILDRGEPARPYSQALAAQVAKVEDTALTPSARLMAELTGGESFFDLALRTSAAHKAYFLELYPPNDERLREFARARRVRIYLQPGGLDTVRELDDRAKRRIDQILLQAVKDPIGPQFMAPPARDSARLPSAVKGSGVLGWSSGPSPSARTSKGFLIVGTRVPAP